jgi:hypothetical protein
MATGVSSESDVIRDYLRMSVEQLAMSNKVYEDAACMLEKKIDEPVPKSKNPSLQDELTKTHAMYQKCLKESLDNIKNQYMLGIEMKLLFEREINFLTLSDSLANIQERLNPLLLQHKKNEAEIKKLESRIVELLDNR